MKQPPSSEKRRQPLPEHRPKPGSEDPEAPGKTRAIIDSPSYRQADHDIDFVSRDDMRDVRLALDYEKAELLLKERGIANTIVVFGSTRISEPAAARRKVESLSNEARSKDKNAVRRLAVAKRILAKMSSVVHMPLKSGIIAQLVHVE